jgi:hypothetical protein
MIALGLFAFIAILALVLDGGDAYSAKRQAQNAADAGALAGATAMCKTKSENAGETVAITYAVTNGAVNPPSVDVSLSSATVVVTATVTKDTFFVGLIGYPQVSPRAVAEAQCRPPVGMGVMPVAWACRPPVVRGIIVPGVDCAEELGPCGTGTQGLACTYIMMDSVKVKGNKKGGKCDPDITDPTDPKYCYEQKDLECSAHGPDLTPPKGCNYVEPTKTDCDLDDDIVDELMTGGARNWLNLDGGGGGASDLKDWIRNGFPDPVYPHTWIPTKNGVSTSVFHTAAQYIVGKDVTLPVFNKICDHYPNDLTNPETLAACNVGTIDIRDVAGNQLNFHVVTFATFHVTCVQTGKKATAEAGYFIDKKDNDCYGHASAVANGSIDENDKSIEGYFIRVQMPGYGGFGDWIDTSTFTVVLVK